MILVTEKLGGKVIEVLQALNKQNKHLNKIYIWSLRMIHNKTQNR